MENIEDFSGKSSEKWASSQKRKTRLDGKSNRTRQENKRGDSKVESNDSPEVPDRGKTSDIPSLPARGQRVKPGGFQTEPSNK